VRSNPTTAALLPLLLACGNAGAAAGPPVASTPTCDPQASDRPDYCGFPADVRAFVDDRDACDHWRGEPWATDEEIRDTPDPTDREAQVDRRKEIIDAVNASCTGTDKRLAALKTAYASDSHVMQLLDGYEPGIEADD